MRKMISLILRIPRVRRYIKRLYDNLRTDQMLSLEPDVVAPEYPPIQSRHSDFDGPRLNLLVPALYIEVMILGVQLRLSFLNYNMGRMPKKS